MTPDANQLFVDTNILIFATNTASPWHTTAYTALQTARSQDVELTISPQVIREYLAAATRPGPAAATPARSSTGSNPNRMAPSRCPSC